MPLTLTDVKAIGDYLERPDGPLGWFIAVIKGDPKANQVANFLTDIHSTEAYEIDALKKILASSGGTAAPVDVQALAQAVAALVTPSEKDALVQVLQTVHS